jgi:mannose-6-phosphate isomerase
MSTTNGPRFTVTDAEVRDKPWGKETVFAAFDDLYIGKVITLHAGQSVSLQRHTEKTETISVLSGQGRFELGETRDDLSVVDLSEGGTVHIPAGVIHRITAITTLVFAEVSTAHPGWNTDIERLEDGFGRSGTVAP